MPIEAPGTLTAKQLAHRWKMTVGTLYNRRTRGDPMPPARRVFRRLQFDEAAVIAFEEEHFGDARTPSGRAQLQEADAALLEIQARRDATRRS